MTKPTTIRLPGTDGPDIVIERGLFERTTIRVDGQVIPRLPLRKRAYAIPLAGGSTHTLVLDHTSTGLQAVTEDGTRIPVGPVIPLWLTAFTIMPLILVVGGIVGALAGGVGVGVNGLISRSDLRIPVKVLAMVGVAVIAGVVWFFAARAVLQVAGDPTLHTGDCVRGAEGDLVIADVRAVDCADEHDGIVVGFIEIPGDTGAPYPGQAAVDVAAEACVARFMEYLDTDWQTSTLGLVYLHPTLEAWDAGDRQIVCIATGSGQTPVEA